MATYNNIKKLKIGDNIFNLYDSGNSGGTVTSIGVSNATNGGLTVSGGPVTSSGTITIGHSNVLSSAQTTQAVYPIKIDKNGHISAYGSAVTIPTVPSNIVNTITTTAGAHTAISSQKGNVSFNIPTKTSHLTNDSGFITTDTNTTYALSGALSSHKFTSTLTAGGSGSGTSTSDFTLAAGTGITITDDTSARKMTIACSVTNTDTKVSTAAVTSGTTYYPVLGADTTSAATKFYDKTGISYTATNGTASAHNGQALLTLGNNLSRSQANWKQGIIRMYGETGNYIELVPTPLTPTGGSNKRIAFPDKSGTIALTSDFNGYLRKPTGDNPFGWKLSSIGTDVPVWYPPETCIIYVSDESDNPGSYGLINTPDEIRDGSNSTLVLDLNMYNSSTDDFDMYRLVNYRIEDIHEDNDYMYQVIWFSGITNYRDGTQIKSRKILCGIYLDYDGQYHTDGEVVVNISNIGEAHTLNGSKALSKSTSFSAIGDTLTLAPGTWLLVGTVEFVGKSDSAYRGIAWHSLDTNLNISASMVTQPAANSTLSTRLQTTLLTTVTTTGQYALWGAQNSSSMTVDWYYRYIKLD